MSRTAVAPISPTPQAGLRCRSCRHAELETILDLGETPLADGLVAAPAEEADPRYPLELAFCRCCALVQILETVPPEVLFCRDYPYFSSFSESWLEHCRANALELIDRCGLNENSLVVEIASNDGYLLKNFVAQGIPVLGVDPAEGPALAARAIGVPTCCEFFSHESAEAMREAGEQADLIIANNVLAHVADTNGFVRGLKTLLKPEGMLVIEFPYLRDLIDHCEFDTIYHQHLCYFSLTSARRLLARHGLHVQDVRRLATHGGSLRLYVGDEEQTAPAVAALLDEERRAGLDQVEYFRDFAERVQTIRRELRELLVRLRGEGKRIVGYAAAAKACTLLNYVGVGPDLLDYVVDRNVHKHGKFMPGVRLRIEPVERLAEDPPDFVLLLAWNLADEILAQQAAYLRGGGRFIVPVPRVRIIP